MKKTTKNDSWSIVRNRACIKALFIFLGIPVIQIIAYLLTFVAMMVWKNCQKGIAGQGFSVVDVRSSTFMAIVSVISSLILIVWCGRKYRRSGWREENFDYRAAFSWQNIIAIIGVAVGGCIFLTIVLTGLECIFPAMFQSYQNIMNHLVDREQVLTMIYVMLIGPIAEEVVFRGAILDELYLVFPFWIANILQAALFGVYHMNFIQGLYAFLLGVIFGAIRNLTGTIFSNISAHILFNSTSMLLPVLLGDLFERKYGICLLLCFSCFGFLTGCYYLWKQIKRKKYEEKTTKK